MASFMLYIGTHSIGTCASLLHIIIIIIIIIIINPKETLNKTLKKPMKPSIEGLWATRGVCAYIHIHIIPLPISSTKWVSWVPKTRAFCRANFLYKIQIQVQN